jgi:dTDP-4-amino-4,6-dideoxygalactose transaminase
MNFFDDTSYGFSQELTNSQSNYWLNTIILENKKQRDLFLEETNLRGVMTRPIWTLMNKLPMFQNSQHGELSNAEWLEKRVVNIPSSVVFQ